MYKVDSSMLILCNKEAMFQMFECRHKKIEGSRLFLSFSYIPIILVFKVVNFKKRASSNRLSLNLRCQIRILRSNLLMYSIDIL
jgi:hypothetical protein